MLSRLGLTAASCCATSPVQRFHLIICVSFPTTNVRRCSTSSSSSSSSSQQQHQQSTNAAFTTKIKVDLNSSFADSSSSSSSSSSPLVQRHSSDAALRKAARISASLPKFGKKAKDEERARKIEQVRKQVQLLAEEEEFLNMTSTTTITKTTTKNTTESISTSLASSSSSPYKDDKELAKAEEDAWSRVSEKYGFATKPAYLATYRAFLYELQKYEINMKLASSDKLIFIMDIVKTNSSAMTMSGGSIYPMEIIDTLVTDADEAHSFSTMLLWTKNILEALHFGAGVSDLRRIGSTLVPFSVPAKYHNRCEETEQRRKFTSEVNQSERNPSSSHDGDPDDVSTFRHSTNIGIEAVRRDYGSNSSSSSSSSFLSSSSCSHHLRFLKLECKMHPETPASLMFPPSVSSSSSSSSANQISVGAQLARWAVVSLERDDAEMNVNMNNNNEKSDKNNNNDLLLTVSLQTWTYMLLASMLSLLSRNDVGIANHELVSTLHAAKDLEPLWHQMRNMSGMHPAPWPIDPRLLWYPGKR